MNRLEARTLPGVVLLSVGLAGVIAEVGGYPAGRTTASFILIGLGLYFMITVGRRQFPWPLFMILPGVFSLVDLLGWSQNVPVEAYGSGTLVIVGIWLLFRVREKENGEDE